MEWSLVFFEYRRNVPNIFRVTGTGKQNIRGGQLLAFNIGGEAQSKARKAIEKMKELAR
jgi:hypothetical protein